MDLNQVTFNLVPLRSSRDRDSQREGEMSLRAAYRRLVEYFLPGESGGGEQQELPLPAARVAVVGAGVGGCCAAYFLREKEGQALAVDVFERGVVGGRTATFKFRDHEYETGASIIHTSNKYLVDFSQQFGK